jgi:uncharacterized protein YutE (UPF0331/DUF86 family)
MEVLQQSQKDLLEAANWFRHSYEICKNLSKKNDFSVSEYDAIESFMSRYARITDLLLRKVFRSIDRVELEQPGSLLDVLNRSEKRELISDAKEVREWTELRNQIVHDYAHQELTALFQDALAFAPKILQTIEITDQYCKKLHDSWSD